MGRRPGVGPVQVEVGHGQDPHDQPWGGPIRERWGLAAHPRMSPALEEKRAFTATRAGSYAAAALAAGHWGGAVDDAVIPALGPRVGSQAAAQTQERLKQPPPERQPQRRASELAVLRVDGGFARFRGPGWGKTKTQQARVAWREIKTGVFSLHEPAGRTAGGRGVLADQTVVRGQGEPRELGRRLHWEALRAGLGRAQTKALFCRSRRAPERSGDGRAGLAPRQWTGGIRRSSGPTALQRHGPILDPARLSPLERPG